MTLHSPVYDPFLTYHCKDVSSWDSQFIFLLYHKGFSTCVDSVDYSHIDEHIFLSYQGIIKLFKSGFHIVSSKILFHGVNGRYKNKMGRTKLGKNNINTLIRWFIYFEFLNKGSKGFEVRSLREIKFTRI